MNEIGITWKASFSPCIRSLSRSLLSILLTFLSRDESVGFLRRPGVPPPPPPPPPELPFDLTRDDPPLVVAMALAAVVDDRVIVEVAICNRPSASVPRTLGCISHFTTRRAQCLKITHKVAILRNNLLSENKITQPLCTYYKNQHLGDPNETFLMSFKHCAKD